MGWGGGDGVRISEHAYIRTKLFEGRLSHRQHHHGTNVGEDLSVRSRTVLVVESDIADGHKWNGDNDGSMDVML